MKKPYVIGIILLGLVVLLIGYLSLRPEPNETVDTTDTVIDIASTTAEAVEKPATKAEPSLRALDVKPWEWVSAVYADGRTVTPTEKGDFVMTFGSGGGVSFKTDCNSMTSSYEAYAGGLTFAPLASTEMYCEGSKETEFAALITATETYRFTERGELILETATGDSVTFR